MDVLIQNVLNTPVSTLIVIKELIFDYFMYSNVNNYKVIVSFNLWISLKRYKYVFWLLVECYIYFYGVNTDLVVCCSDVKWEYDQYCPRIMWGIVDNSNEFVVHVNIDVWTRQCERVRTSAPVCTALICRPVTWYNIMLLSPSEADFFLS